MILQYNKKGGDIVNSNKIRTLEKFNIIGRKKHPVAAVLLLLLTVVFIVLGVVVPSFTIVVVIVPITSAIFFYLAAAVFLSLSIAMFKGVDTVHCPYCGAEYYAAPDKSRLRCKKCGKDSRRG